jgi:hypothetical protein
VLAVEYRTVLVPEFPSQRRRFLGEASRPRKEWAEAAGIAAAEVAALEAVAAEAAEAAAAAEGATKAAAKAAADAPSTRAALAPELPKEPDGAGGMAESVEEVPWRPVFSVGAPQLEIIKQRVFSGLRARDFAVASVVALEAAYNGGRRAPPQSLALAWAPCRPGRRRHRGTRGGSPRPFCVGRLR